MLMSGEHHASGRFSPGSKPMYLLNMGLGDPQSWSGRLKEEKQLLPLWDTKSGSSDP
jgi:hypothetical protein